MSSLELAAGPPRVFLSLSSPGRPAQKAFVASLMSAIASHDMTPVRVTGPSPAPLEPIRQIMQTCQGTGFVVAMARNRVVEGIDYANGGKDGHRYRERYLTTEWVQIESALAYQLGHPILVLREDTFTPPACSIRPPAGSPSARLATGKCHSRRGADREGPAGVSGTFRVTPIALDSSRTNGRWG